MLRGHLDALDHESISGWAADDASPEAIVEILIYVNGRKAARVACAAPRSDLRQMGIFGEGAHGFRYQFDVPLSRSVESRVEARFVHTGRLLSKGDVLLHRDTTRVIGGMAGQASSDGPELFPAPRDPRTMFEAMALYEREAGLLDLLGRLDLTDQDPRHIAYIVLGSGPAWLQRSGAKLSVGDRSEYVPRDQLNELLRSDNFQGNLIPLFLDAFPEKERLIFIHIPKCAGTDLFSHLARRFPSLHQTIMEPAWTTKEVLFERLSRLVVESRFFRQIFISGHSSLDYFSSRDLLRPQDQVFTVLRDPLGIAMSQVNYVMTRMTDDAASGNVGTDTRKWLDILGLESLPTNMTPACSKKLCSAILRLQQIVKPNSMCSWLGGTDAASAIDQMVASDIEVTVTPNYNTWIREKWNVTQETRHNQSKPFTSLGDLPYEDLDYVQMILSEDIKLYAAVERALERAATSSIVAEQLA
jgi:hypothetical protein